MTHLPAAVEELARLGVRAEATSDEGREGVVVDGCAYLAGRGQFASLDEALEWAAIVATLARGVRA